MNIKSLLSYDSLFNYNTAFVSPQEKLVFIAGAIAFLVGIVLKISASMAPNPIDKKFRQGFYKVFIFFGVCEMIWYVFRYENAIFFGTHFVAALVALISIIWLVVLIVKFIRNYSQEKTDWDKEQLKQKYLPK